MDNKFIKGVYINREFSWLQFNKRVLDEADNKNNPLIERCKFLSIFSSNLDEFYMVRVGSLHNQSIAEPSAAENKTGLTAEQQISGILAETKKLYKTEAAVYAKIKDDLKERGIKLLSAKELSKTKKAEAEAIFVTQMLPLLSPMVLDAKHPLMRFMNMQSYFVYKLNKGDRTMFGVMPVPSKLPPLYRLSGENAVSLITSVEILREFGGRVFEGYQISANALVRVCRNADFDADESGAGDGYNYDFSKYLKEKVESRAGLDAVRLEINSDSDDIRDFLLKALNLKKSRCFCIRNCFDYKFLFSVEKFIDPNLAAALKYPPLKQNTNEHYKNVPMIETVLNRDVFLSYPFDSMEPLIKLLDECAVSREVSSIKITIYRLDKHSRIVDALKKAAENGIDVTVIIELCARFDEENNLYQADVLRAAGCTIFYGFKNYKVHSKILSIILKRGESVRYITHLGTGNYNEGTSRQYTDMNILTADSCIGMDAAAFFRNLSIGNIGENYKKLLIAPNGLKQGLIKEIDREIEAAKEGKPACITAKMNSLTDSDMIKKFIEASKAGVKVNLIVRGICCLLPGKEGKSENINIISIVGRFLEHSRIYSFGEGETRRTFISSADLMTRNTDKRVEIATPVLDKEIENEIHSMLNIMLSDNVKGRRLTKDGTYIINESGGGALDSQTYFLNK